MILCDFSFNCRFKKLIEQYKANSENWSTTHDIDALITVEVLLVTPDVADAEYLQIANIQFNNLDIIGMCLLRTNGIFTIKFIIFIIISQQIKRQSLN